MNSELNKQTNEELCLLIAKTKLQLLEARFLQASGDLEKINKAKNIKKVIARALTILNTRKIAFSMGTHGIIMLDKNTGKTTNLTSQVSGQFMSSQQTTENKQKNSKSETKKANSFSKNQSFNAKDNVKKQDKKGSQQSFHRTSGNSSSGGGA
ncbi:MAG: 50S ribosomal protein L29 [Mycoplasmataceae bacterium]|jgi:large subunit ribosomal protein L29|nr:50S ribosomal protein L29 [Mycoplasmataceae bacterium]